MSIWHINEKVCRNLKYVFIKFAQSHSQKCKSVLFPKNMGKESNSGTKNVLKL
jgi:hypothetical protein